MFVLCVSNKWDLLTTFLQRVLHNGTTKGPLLICLRVGACCSSGSRTHQQGRARLTSAQTQSQVQLRNPSRLLVGRLALLWCQSHTQCMHPGCHRGSMYPARKVLLYHLQSPSLLSSRRPLPQ